MRKPPYIPRQLPRTGRAITSLLEDGVQQVREARPLAQYLDDAAHVFGGIAAVLGLVEVSELEEAAFNDGNDADPFLSPFVRSELIGLAKTAARLMSREAERVSEWADEYMLKEGRDER